jgi:hypothetical protein
MPVTSSNSRIVINPIDDRLIAMGEEYISKIGRANEDELNRIWGVFTMLLEIRMDQGERFEFPDQYEYPDEKLIKSDYGEEWQSVKIAGNVVRELRMRQGRGYT